MLLCNVVFHTATFMDAYEDPFGPYHRLDIAQFADFLRGNTGHLLSIPGDAKDKRGRDRFERGRERE